MSRETRIDLSGVCALASAMQENCTASRIVDRCRYAHGLYLSRVRHPEVLPGVGTGVAEPAREAGEAQTVGRPSGA